MRKYFTILALIILILPSCGKREKDVSAKMITPVKFSDVKINDSFWTPRLKSHKDVTLNV